MTQLLSTETKTSHKIYSLINALVLALVIWWNYYSNTGNIGGKTVGELSAEYDNYFTPAGYAFSIWGIIYLALTLQAIFFLRRAFSQTKDSDFLSQIGPYLILTNLLNAAWLWFWLMEHTGISVIVMLAILSSLVVLILNLNMNKWKAPSKIRWFVQIPISIYAGWITVATVANISAYLTKYNWSAGPIDEITWAIIMMAVAALVNIFILFNRSLIAYPLVGIWALFAISVRHAGTQTSLQGAALICMGSIFLALAFQLIRQSLLARKRAMTG